MNAPERIATERQTFIGGSDVAGILGVSPWDSPLDVFLKKTEPRREESKPDVAKERLFRWGKLLEPVVVKHLRLDYGVKVTKVSSPRKPNRYIDPEHPFLAAEIDFEWRVTKEIAEEHGLDQALVGTVQNGEIKTVHSFAAAKFGEAETEDVPVEYAAQAMHGLMVTGRKLCMFGVLTGTRDVTIYWIKRDEETIAAMRPRLVKFWHEHVLPRIPPPAVNLPDVVHLLKRVKPIDVPATPEVEQLLVDLEKAKQARDAAEAQEVELKYQLGQFVLGATGILLGKGGLLTPAAEIVPGKHVITSAAGAPLLTLAVQQQTKVDVALVREKHPEVAEECSRTHNIVRFDPPRKKKAA